MRTRRISFMSATGLAIAIGAGGVAAWQLPAATERGSWERHAAASRAAAEASLEQLEDTRAESDDVTEAVADEREASEALEKRIAKQRKTIASLEKRIRDLGGNPDKI